MKGELSCAFLPRKNQEKQGLPNSCNLRDSRRKENYNFSLKKDKYL